MFVRDLSPIFSRQIYKCFLVSFLHNISPTRTEATLMTINDENHEHIFDAIVVYINDRKICTASHKNSGIISAEVTLYNKFNPGSSYIALAVSGTNHATKDHLNWIRCALQLGDEVRFIIERTDQIDEPNEVETHEQVNNRMQNLPDNK